MRLDAASLQAFYESPLGGAARQAVLARVRAAWEDVSGRDVLGLGFAAPLLEGLRGVPRRRVSLCPAGQGAVRWPAEGASTTLVCDETRLPLRDAVFDRVILAHAIEEAEAPQRLLREVWRVMAPEGRVIVLAANRVGLWALNDSQPFGQGRPFSRTQLADLLRASLFEPVATAKALYCPPLAWPGLLATAHLWERAGAFIAPALGGIVLVEAVKRLEAPPPGVRAPVRGAGRVLALARPGAGARPARTGRPDSP